ncbi:hypothetical protein [Streptococcus uberis]|uniref:hypothetical protein n=1 Tax=Streptococcus uberis TaxID=1349 RepID=UPI00193A8DF7|nr:hypothetical protein [Streptococcus uberis]
MDTNRIIVIANTNGRYEESNRVYSSEGIVATLAARDYKGPKLIAIKNKKRNKNRLSDSQRGGWH